WPVEVERVLRSTEEWFDGTGGPDQLRGEAIPLESRVASVVVASFLEGVTADDEPLNSQFPGRFDPTVLAALEQLEQANETYPSAAEHRTLLSLARALEEAGNAASARQAFAKLAESSPSRFSVEALSGLARISMAEGAADEACDYAVEAARRAQQVGPTQTANTALEVALMLVRCNRPDQSLPWLDTADRAYASLGIEAGRAAVKIAVWVKGKESTRT
ncbi:MAG: hypothetical protein KC910_21505, partial [Candidatus Eremiobacteraeota bacterium]|nr:hypothetical protein [Candidatus Eremiobacteraeota bacterium]